jgi:hypothetical protein
LLLQWETGITAFSCRSRSPLETLKPIKTILHPREQ